MIKLTIEMDEDTPVVALVGVVEAVREAGLSFRLERQRLPKPVVEGAVVGELGAVAAYREAMKEAQRWSRGRELRREAEHRAERLPRARFGDWWEQA